MWSNFSLHRPVKCKLKLIIQYITIKLKKWIKINRFHISFFHSLFEIFLAKKAEIVSQPKAHAIVIRFDFLDLIETSLWFDGNFILFYIKIKIILTCFCVFFLSFSRSQIFDYWNIKNELSYFKIVCDIFCKRKEINIYHVSWRKKNITNYFRIFFHKKIRNIDFFSKNSHTN